MTSRELIEKINSLWHKQKTVGLTEAEKKEQKQAREEYLAAMRGQVRGILESIRNPEDAQIGEEKHNNSHSGECSCKKCKH